MKEEKPKIHYDFINPNSKQAVEALLRRMIVEKLHTVQLQKKHR